MVLMLTLIYLVSLEEISYVFAQIISEDFNDASALNNKGDALYNLGRYQEAMIYYDKALAIDPKNIDAIKGKQQALAALNQTE